MVLAASIPYRPPLAWKPLLAFLAARAIPGVEAVDDQAYRRVIVVDGHCGHIEIRQRPDRHALELRAHVAESGLLPQIIERTRRVFDVDADPEAIAAHFRGDAVLAPRVRRLPGLRVPGAWDPFELGVRAILGQQVTVKGASTLAGRLVSLCGQAIEPLAPGLTHVFPRPHAVAAADLSTLGVPMRRRESLQSFATAVAHDEQLLHRQDCGTELLALPGFGEWTVQYVLMRACGEPDAFPASDLWLRRAAGATTVSALLEQAEAWRPFRAYAAMYLWHGGEP